MYAMGTHISPLGLLGDTHHEIATHRISDLEIARNIYVVFVSRDIESPRVLKMEIWKGIPTVCTTQIFVYVADDFRSLEALRDQGRAGSMVCHTYHLGWIWRTYVIQDIFIRPLIVTLYSLVSGASNVQSLINRCRKIPQDEAFYLEDSFYLEIRAPILVVSREWSFFPLVLIFM